METRKRAKTLLVGDPINTAKNKFHYLYTNRDNIKKTLSDQQEYNIDYFPTVIDNNLLEITLNNVETLVSVWNTSGQEADDHRRLRVLSYPQTDLIVLFYSIHDRESFENVTAKWFPEIQLHCPHTPILLVQIDNTATQKDRIKVSVEEVEALNHKLSKDAVVSFKTCTLNYFEAVEKKLLDVAPETYLLEDLENVKAISDEAKIMLETFLKNEHLLRVNKPRLLINTSSDNNNVESKQTKFEESQEFHRRKVIISLNNLKNVINDPLIEKNIIVLQKSLSVQQSVKQVQDEKKFVFNKKTFLLVANGICNIKANPIPVDKTKKTNSFVSNLFSLLSSQKEASVEKDKHEDQWNQVFEDLKNAIVELFIKRGDVKTLENFVGSLDQLEKRNFLSIFNIATELRETKSQGFNSAVDSKMQLFDESKHKANEESKAALQHAVDAVTSNSKKIDEINKTMTKPETPEVKKSM